MPGQILRSMILKAHVILSLAEANMHKVDSFDRCQLHENDDVGDAEADETKHDADAHRHHAAHAVLARTEVDMLESALSFHTK